MGNTYADARLLSLIHKGLNRERTTADDMLYALSFDENSIESKLITSSWDRFMRSCCNDTGEIGIQIGVITGPCPGECGFCNFNRKTTTASYRRIDHDVLKSYVRDAVKFGDVNNIAVMTVHNADIDDILGYVHTVRNSVPENVRITINTGDLSPEECKELRKAGVTGAYHALRMGEGKDNLLNPETRKKTWRNFMDAGISVSCGTEPIGPEHTNEEIVSNYMEGIKAGCLNGGTSLRVPVPGTPMGNMPILSVARMKQISSTLSLLSTWYHSDSPLNKWNFGFSSGGNKAYAEYAGNPRDTIEDSEKGVGHTVAWCRRLLYAGSFKHILKANGSIVDLNIDYLENTESV